MKIRALLSLLVLAACTEQPHAPGPVDVEMTVSVDPAAPPPQPNVDVVVENRSDRTIYVLDHCGGIVAPRFQRRVGGAWVDARFGVPCFAVVTPPIEVAPGAGATGAISVHEPGRYRSMVYLATGLDGEVAELSHEFTVGS